MSNTDLDAFFANSGNIFAEKPRKRAYEDRLVLEPGNEYLVRLLPYLKEGKEGFNKTFFKFKQYAWQSIVDGRWVYVQSPATWGEPCPISRWYYDTINNPNASASAKAQAEKLSKGYSRNTYYNVYVVDDPVNPANNGTVKILKAGAQIDNIIQEALSSDPKVMYKFQEEFDVENMRNAIFDLSPNGINLNIVVQKQGNFSNYKTSRFVRRNRNLGLSDAEQKAIYDKVVDLTTIDRRVSVDEAVERFSTTFLGVKAAMPANDVQTSAPAPTKSANTYDDSDTTDLDNIGKELEELDLD